MSAWPVVVLLIISCGSGLFIRLATDAYEVREARAALAKAGAA